VSSLGQNNPIGASGGIGVSGSTRTYWEGSLITSPLPNQIFVFGSNPEGRHGAGLAKHALQFGATYGKGRGLSGSTYALVTKNLTRGYLEPSTGIKYHKYGGISKRLLSNNIRELYECAKINIDKQFLVPYKVGDENLNGYTTEEIIVLFKRHKIPNNVVFHESVRGLLWGGINA
jgi:hypothetical protein